MEKKLKGKEERREWGTQESDSGYLEGEKPKRKRKKSRPRPSRENGENGGPDQPTMRVRGETEKRKEKQWGTKMEKEKYGVGLCGSLGRE